MQQLIVSFERQRIIETINLIPVWTYSLIRPIGKLPSDVVLLVLEELAKSGNASPLDKTKQRWLVYWHTLEEWGDIIYNWAHENGFNGSVCTLFELTQGEDTTNQGTYFGDSWVCSNNIRRMILLLYNGCLLFFRIPWTWYRSIDQSSSNIGGKQKGRINFIWW